MTRKIVLATGNADKVTELTELFGSMLGVEVVAASSLGDMPEVIEDGETLEANALKKAREIAAVTGELCVADDTGLEVDALDGAPGVYAARFAGEGCSYEDNCRKLLAELDGVPRRERTARFRTVMAVVDPQALRGFEQCVDGALEGEILDEMRGDRGFGYDPLFYVPDFGRTLAELELSEKNRISHRARASRAMRDLLGRHLS